MKLYYDQEIDYLEVFFQDYHLEANYGQNYGDGITVFHSEKTDQVLGYAFEKASVLANESKLLSVKVVFINGIAKTVEQTNF